MSSVKVEFNPIVIQKTGIYGFAVFAPISIAFSQICIGLTLIGWLTKILRNKSINWQYTPLDIPIAIYVLTQLLAVLFSNDILIGFKSWINTDWFILFYFAIIHLIDDENDFKWIIILLAFSGAISALYGIIQHFSGLDLLGNNLRNYPYGNFYRSIGFFSLPLTYGGVQLCLFLFIVPFYFAKESVLIKKVLLILIILIFISILASYARSAWLGLGGVLFLLLFFLPRRLVVYLTATFIAGLILVYFIHPDLLFTMGILSMFDVSESAPYNNIVRLRLWESSWNLIKDNWLIGVGYSNFADIFENYKVPFDYRGLTDPHNDLLKVFALSGLSGFVSFIYLWFIDLRSKLKTCLPGFIQNMDIRKAGTVGSFFVVSAFLIAGLTQEYYHDAETAQLWWFTVAMGMIGVNSMRMKTSVE